ncbi:helix-turn-helix domain-containing protein [Winogradskyella sp. SYSU M77433]|uniref:AraC family transcriptional regulator n=1 Tax=Winogradskyella sp. SYSU M77433 TaxID=3042722 RepID=UPI00248040AB|nr:helix-turn-helix domain-containing protein [Winogradskyella sp. SYSU M77433]MDH7913879.1 helix-turn-helix domain-containing protein [Winogradskyella sp. SYSU M77433]
MLSDQFPKVLLLDVSAVSDLPDDFYKHYHTHMFCLSGNIKFMLNNDTMQCNGGDFLFWFAQSQLLQIQTSNDFKASVLLVEKQLLDDNVPNVGYAVNALLHSRVNPIKIIQNKKVQQKIISNFKVVNQRYLNKTHKFYEEALSLQLKLFVLEMWNTFANEYESKKHTRQTNAIYEGFITLLHKHSMQQREVQFYSNQLHITPKYLNQICKSISDLTASAWIQRYVRERLIILLEDKSLNISEIADEMEFSSRSFFTRYAKKILGVTPTEYRDRLS